MKTQPLFFFNSLLLQIILFDAAVAGKIGVCYGRVANNLPHPSDVVNLLKSNGISKVRLFDADPEVLHSFSGTGIDLMIGVPNEMLPPLADGSPDFAIEWLRSNVLSAVSADQIQYLAVGNEIFLKDPFYTSYLVPALRKLHLALQMLNLGNKIKLSSPQAADVLSNSFPPSDGLFDSYILPAMHPLLQFLMETEAPFMANIYPFFSYTNNPSNIPLGYALFNSTPVVFDGLLMYDNLFDATVDAIVAAMEREGFPGIEVVVTETGWPTSGGGVAAPENALSYNANIIRRASNGVGTPKRPGVGVETFLFGLFDEDEKPGEEYERHFGLFSPIGVKAYDLAFA